MKRSNLIIFAMILAFCFTQTGAWAAPGDSKSDPILIKTAAELDAVRNDLNKFYKLNNDIDLVPYLTSGDAGYTQWGTAGWLPIGSSATPFTGNFDGAGHVIKGLWMSRSNQPNMGLFGYATNATFENISVEIGTLTNSVIGGAQTGGLVGFLYSNGGSSSILNCRVSGSVSSTYYYGNCPNVGGLVGAINSASSGSSSITNCHATSDVKASSYSSPNIGGLVGYVYTGGGGNTSFKNCYSAGSVSNTFYSNNVGGLVGNLLSESSGSSSIENCYSTSSVIVTSNPNSFIGGLVGNQQVNGGSSRISNSYSMSGISAVGGNSSFGGLIGQQSATGGTLIVENCYATGAISLSSNNQYVGGLVGLQTLDAGGNISIMACYAKGIVTAYNYVGGLVGYQTLRDNSSVSIANCYATGAVTANNINAGGLVAFQSAGGYVSNSSITNSYSTSNVVANNFACGLVGQQAAPNGATSLLNCYSVGDVVARTGSDVGGVVGSQDVPSNNRISSNYRYISADIRQGSSPIVVSDDPNSRHGGTVTSVDLTTKSTYTGNSWLFNDTVPVGPWYWDVKKFPKLNIGREVSPFYFLITLTGPTEMWLPVGYPLTYTDEYIATGKPDPIISYLIDTPYIEWVEGTRRLKILPGLPAGKYIVYLTASNGVYPDDNLTFVLTVGTGGVKPEIEGPSEMTIYEGYSTSYSDPFTITGTSPITVSLNSAYSRIVWEPNKIQVDPGLLSNDYHVVLVASNDYGEARHNFVAKVRPDLPEEPKITGVTSITLYKGYSPTYTSTYTVTGNPKPYVKVSSDFDSIIEWDDSNRVYIKSGLPVDDHLVVITAENRVGSATLRLIITVKDTPPGGSLNIAGITSMLLTVGYAPTSTSQYFITGNPAPVVSITSDATAITWNEKTQKIDIAAGLWAGSYTVVLTASNGAEPDVRLFFTLTVLTRNGHGDGYGGSLDSNSGCDAGYGLLAFALLAVPFMLRRRYIRK